ncbi:MAG TPA: hypothetical protein VFB80_21980 [Pirellulaceae bacterium]|nr:hypothetical protein [Pirellulaceae bacterium]
MENKPAPAAAPPAAPAKPPSSGSTLRLLILLGVLLLCVGALAYDYLILKPSCDKAYADIQSLVDERNKQGVKDGKLVTSEDIQKLVGFSPTWTKEEDKDGYTIEHYCWWGKVPLLSRRRHFIAIVYTGNKPRHFSSHYQEEPPVEALPLMQTPPPVDPNAPPLTLEGATVLGSGSENKGKDEPGKTPDSTDKPTTPEPPAEKSKADETPKPADTKPADAKAADSKPAETKPEEKAKDNP